MRIGITGGIGTGKTYIGKYIKSKGYSVIDADNIARELMLKGNNNYLNIIEVFGSDILDSNCEIDKKKLRKIVFHDEVKRHLLNSITHPNIIKKILESSNDDKIYFIEMPLIFEENLDKYFDFIWLVNCSKEVQIKRVIERNNLSEAEVLDIIRCQMPSRDKKKRADIIIDTEQKNINKYIDELIYSLEKRVENEN
ncbi:MAG: dephospho-CoA kinase [Firmicutes bacterium]|nr:dephospho-CoA kinase [Bacillota bacterium]